MEFPAYKFKSVGIDSATTALLAASFLDVVVTATSGNDTEGEMLYCLLSDIGFSYPELVGMTYEGLQDKIHAIFSKSFNPIIICAVSAIFRMAQDQLRPSSNNEVTEVSHKTILQELADTKATISRLTISMARYIGWHTQLTIGGDEGEGRYATGAG
ncbi:hypothetical protein C8F01DRAFT_232523 [Mycena amicta]|nr:hypothetical protein C8F01DRAFT_232523 [Mycena amicta]